MSHARIIYTSDGYFRVTFEDAWGHPPSTEYYKDIYGFINKEWFKLVWDKKWSKKASEMRDYQYSDEYLLFKALKED